MGIRKIEGFEHRVAQVPFDEGLLSNEGETVLARKINCVKGKEPLRFAFYMHYWNPELPLRWTYGHIVEEGRQLYVTSGIGTSGLPIRIGIPPEIALIEIMSRRPSNEPRSGRRFA